MDFRAAKKKYRRLAHLNSVGWKPDPEFRAEVAKIAVTDADGRTWRIDPTARTGAWQVDEAGTRREATPPGMGDPAVLTFEELTSEGGLGRVLAIWAVLFGLVAAGLWLFSAQVREDPSALLGVGLAAIVSLVLMIRSRSSAWSGRVEEIREEQVWIAPRPDDAVPGHYETRTFARVKCDGGRVRRLPAMRGWEVGDHLVKARGSAMIHRG